MENEKKFEFSEMYIFGKFDTFSKRLQKIIDMFVTFELYSHLSDSKIEGMDQNELKNKTRDFPSVLNFKQLKLETSIFKAGLKYK